MELILMGLKIAQLSKLLATSIQLAGEWFGSLVYNLVRSNVAPLCKLLATVLARKWSLTSVSALMRLQIAHLGEFLATARLCARIWLVSAVCTSVDLEMSFLEKAFVASLEFTLVSLLCFLSLLFFLDSTIFVDQHLINSHRSRRNAARELSGLL